MKAKALTVVVLLTVPLWAQTNLPAKDGRIYKMAPSPSLRPLLVPAQPHSVLPNAAVGAGDRLAAIRGWNEEGRLPQKVGIQRELPAAIDLRSNRQISVSSAREDYAALVARIEVEESWALRVKFEDYWFPDGTEITVFGSDLSGVAVDATNRDELWAPMVRGPFVLVQILVPQSARGALRGMISRVAEIMPLQSDSEGTVSIQNDTCLVDRSCRSGSHYQAIEAHSGATALMVWPKGEDSVGICSGALLNDTDDSGYIPYFLTANHCVDTQSTASTIEFLWDYRSGSCGGPAPDPLTVPRSSGATLLATSATSDFSFFRISQVPSDRWYLGWDARPSAVPGGTLLNRVAHPNGSPQAYSQTYVVTNTAECIDTHRPNYLYSLSLDGSVKPGASGGLVSLENGQVVGTLSGGCGADDNCDPSAQTVDGTLSAAWPLIGQYLSPGTAPNDTCTPDQNTACLLNNRFRAKLRYRGAFDNQPVNTNGFVKAVSGFGDSNFETAFFYFNSPSNIEVLLKMLDQGNKNGAGQPTIAVLFGTATPLRAELTITDTKTGATKTYTSNFNEMKGTTDFTAFVK